jgi:hypothetical protein
LARASARATCDREVSIAWKREKDKSKEKERRE